MSYCVGKMSRLGDRVVEVFIGILFFMYLAGLVENPLLTLFFFDELQLNTVLELMHSFVQVEVLGELGSHRKAVAILGVPLSFYEQKFAPFASTKMDMR